MNEANCIYERRFGTFRVSEYNIKNDPDAVMALLGRCLVLKADYEFATQTIRYEAASPEFEPCGAGEMPRDYNAQPSMRVEGEPLTFEFQRL